MVEPAHRFARNEYDVRLARTRAAIDRAGLDAIVVTDPSNMAWLSGYDGWSFYVHQALLVSLDGALLWWGRAMDANGARRTTFLDETDIVGYEDRYVQNPPAHPMQDLAALIRERGLGRARIGLEMDNYYFSAAAYTTLVAELPDARLGDATGLVNWQRAIKSPTEIDYMRRAARIVERMHEVIRERARPGLRKNELVAEIYHAAITGADGHWGDYPAIVPMTPSGLDATAPHLTWDDRPMQSGEMTFFEIAGAHARYHCPQSRTVFLGRPPQPFLDAEKAVLEATEAALETARPGNQCEDVAVAFDTALGRHGFTKDSRCGYSIGLSYPPDWGERTMSFRRGDRTVLEPGMTFHFMPALWLDDGGIEITEPILITENGAECLCQTPRALVVKD